MITSKYVSYAANLCAAYTAPVSSARVIDMDDDQLVNMAVQMSVGTRLGCSDLRSVTADDLTASRFFGNGRVQAKLISALMRGTLMDPQITQHLRVCVPAITSDSQDEIVKIKLSWLLDTLNTKPDLAFVLRFFDKISPGLKEEIMSAVVEGKFSLETSLNAVIENLSILVTNDTTRNLLVRAISEGRFAISKKTIIGMAGELGVFLGEEGSLINEKEQKDIADAVRVAKFSFPEALIELIANLSIFSYSSAQCRIALAMYNHVFGTEKGVLMALARNLSKFTHKDSQTKVVEAILKDCFGKEPQVLQQLADNFPNDWSDEETQLFLAQAVCNKKFGGGKNMKVMIKKLSTPMAAKVQSYLSTNLIDGKFDSDLSLKSVVEEKLDMKPSSFVTEERVDNPSSSAPPLPVEIPLLNVVASGGGNIDVVSREGRERANSETSTEDDSYLEDLPFFCVIS